jgi:hypothetical protein
VKRGLLSTAAMALAVLAVAASSQAAGTDPPPVTASVDSIATPTVDNLVVNFDFDLYNCPAGSPIVIVDWSAQEPDRADSGAASAGNSYGLSNGDHVQHLSLSAGASGFLAGEKWFGSGQIACGSVVVPVVGSGMTKSLNGV